MKALFVPSMSQLRDPAFLVEQFDQVIARAPRYLGCSSAMTKHAPRYVSAFTNDAHVLLRDKGGVVGAFLNSCRHRNGQIVPVGMVVDGKTITRQGKVLQNGNIMCPWHRWAYSGIDGSLIHAPTFRGEGMPCAQKNKLHTVPLEEFEGLFFEAGKDVASQLGPVMESPGFKKFGIIPFRFGHRMGLFRSEGADETFHTTTFMEAFGDTDHVDDIHKDSFDQLVDMNSLFLEYGGHYSVQFVGWRTETTVVCGEYDNYRRQVLLRGGAPKYGAVWMAYGPNMTFEWYPLGVDEHGEAQHAFVVSVCVPDGTKSKTVVEFFFPESVLASESDEHPGIARALYAAYSVTVEEDRFLVNSMENGRRTLAAEGKGSDLIGPAHAHQEGCVTHYWNLLGGYLEGIKPTEELVAA